MIALRSVLRRPLSTTVLVLTLGIGMGAVAVVAALFSAVLFPALPYHEPARLLVLWSSARPGATQQIDYLFRKRTFAWLASPPQSLEAVAAVGSRTAIAHTPVGAQRIANAVVSGSFFPLLGAPAARGRLFVKGDDDPSSPPVAVLSSRAWHTLFRSDPSILGRSVRIDSAFYTVVGIAPVELDYPRGTDLWVLAPQVSKTAQPVAWLLIGRLHSAVPFEAARAEIMAKSRLDLRTDSLEYMGQGVTALRLISLERRIGQGLLPVVAVSLVALYAIATLNIAILLLLQVGARSREFAVRAALGAGPWGVLRPVLSELGVQFVAGGALAFVTAITAVRYARGHYLFTAAPLTWRAEAFAATAVSLLALGTAALLVLVISSQARAKDLFAILRRTGETTTTDARSRRARRWLIGTEIAVAVMLACAAGIVGKALRHFEGVDAGFDADRVVVARPDYKAAAYDDIRELAVGENARAQLSRPPGISDVTYWRRIPQPYPPPSGERLLAVEDNQQSLTPDGPYSFYEVGPRFFETLGLRLVEGRFFDVRDQSGAPAVAIINRVAAERWWPSESALGKRLTLHPDAPHEWMTIIGVVESTALDGIDRNQVARGIRRLQLYRPLEQGGPRKAPYWQWDRDCGYCPKLAIAARASQDVNRAAAAFHQVISEVAPGLPTTPITSMYREQIGPAGFSGPVLEKYARTIATFAIVALALAMLGVYAVIADALRYRTRELAIRRALGATATGLLRMIVRENAILAAAATVAGAALYVNFVRVGGALLFGGQYRPLLFRQNPFDPYVLAPIIVLALAVVAVAVTFATRKALSIDPRDGLRTE